MFLAIEIGGTKLQMAVGSGDGGPLAACVRADVEPEKGAEDIRRQVEKLALELIGQHPVEAVGIGFGGPVDLASGRTITSHQVDGWNDFPLTEWCVETFGLPTTLANDSDCAGLAEARFGAGRGNKVVFYSNVGSGIGGALILDGELFRGSSGVAAELGQLRPGLLSDRPDQTVESIASGWGIRAAAQARLSEPISHPLGSMLGGRRPTQPDDVRQRLIEIEEADELDAAGLLEFCDGQIDQLTAKQIAEAASEGNQLAREVIDRACQAYGWALAQMITLLAPNVVVIGGGVSLMSSHLWLIPLRHHVRRYVFPPLKSGFELVRASLGEEVVLHGALALAAADSLGNK